MVSGVLMIESDLFRAFETLAVLTAPLREGFEAGDILNRGFADLKNAGSMECNSSFSLLFV